MCGIAGMAGVEDKELLNAMLEITRHRGPDDWGTYVAGGASTSGRVALGNNRLKILDLSSAGHQPMGTPDGSVWVVFNGEIFNFLELREQLERDGVRFRSHTDTEVLPYLYLKYGSKMVEHLNGMFAFAIWDTEQKLLMIARDRMGVKPLYYVQIGERLYFASEIKALLACPEIEPELDPSALGEFLSLLYVPNPGTMFKGVRKLPQAHILLWQNGQVDTKEYWNETTRIEPFCEPDSAVIEGFREVLKDAVRRQLISDVPLGFFLSGGLDSSALVACASQVHQGTLRGYSIVFTDEHGAMEQSNQDAHFAQVVAKHFDLEWHEILVHPDVVDLLPKLLYYMDEPIVDPAAIATYLICREAKPSVTVMLSGMGGDELFAGYRVHLAHRITRLLRMMPGAVRRGPLVRLLKLLAKNKDRLPGMQPGLALAISRFGQRMLMLSDTEPIQQYAAFRSYFDDNELNYLLCPEIQHECVRPHADRLLEHFSHASELDFIDQMLYVDHQTFLPDFNLAYSDKMSMAASIETRVPLIDNVVVDFMRRVPTSMKIRGLTQKYILKRAMEGILPRDVIYRRKTPFSIPVRAWIRKELREMVRDTLSADHIRRRGVLNPTAVARILDDNESNRRDYTLQIWALLTLELWQQCFVDGKGLPVATTVADC